MLKGATNAFQDRRINLVQFEFGGCNLDTRTSLADFFHFFKERAFTIGLIQPSGRIQMLSRYDEFFEQYRTANFVAIPDHVQIAFGPLSYEQSQLFVVRCIIKLPFKLLILNCSS